MTFSIHKKADDFLIKNFICLFFYPHICMKDLEKEELKAPQNETSENERVCPRCGNPLVLREAKRGEHIGEKFWGCSNFPHCRYMEKAQ